MSFFTQVSTKLQNFISGSRNKLIAKLTNKPGSVENADSLQQQIDYLNANNQLDIHIAKMLKGVLGIRNMRARDLMIPRAHIDYFYSDDSLREVLNSVLEYGHSRYPVLTDDAEDQDSIGLLFTKDLLRILIDDKIDQVSLLDISKPIKIIPETKHVTTLLQEFQNSHTHLALVVNEFGEISGLITIEDILEEIVGDISDEFDKDNHYIQQVSKTSYDVLARTPIYLFNQAFQCELSDDEYETIGGYVLGLLGHLPTRNESVEIIPDVLIARITQVNERQILKLRVRTSPEYALQLQKDKKVQAHNEVFKHGLAAEQTAEALKATNTTETLEDIAAIEETMAAVETIKAHTLKEEQVQEQGQTTQEQVAKETQDKANVTEASSSSAANSTTDAIAQTTSSDKVAEETTDSEPASNASSTTNSEVTASTEKTAYTEATESTESTANAAATANAQATNAQVAAEENDFSMPSAVSDDQETNNNSTSSADKHA
ncbi:transporter associated domain-containing protein [Psittacicella hinzii]|nr:transporter associated domain-containing protein [Psittacicella hinzii]